MPTVPDSDRPSMYKRLFVGIIFFFSGVSMASSLVLPSAGSLSGQWTITDKSNSCTIHLSAENVESANGYKLSILSTCSPEILPQVPVAWRPTPDGIALLDQDGLSVLFFSREGMHYRSHIWERTGKVLKKNGTVAKFAMKQLVFVEIH